MVLRGGSFLLYLSPPMTIFLRCECGGDGDVSMSLLAYVLLIITVESNYDCGKFYLCHSIVPLMASPTGLFRPPHSCQVEWVPHVELPATCHRDLYFPVKGGCCIYSPLSCLFMPFAHYPVVLQVLPLGWDDVVVLIS